MMCDLAVCLSVMLSRSLDVFDGRGIWVILALSVVYGVFVMLFV